MTNIAKIAVLGSGSWGTALAHHLRRNGRAVTVWGPEPDVIADINRGWNSRYFPKETLAAGLLASEDLSEVIEGAEVVVFAVPSFAVRDVASKAKLSFRKGSLVVSAAKGLEDTTLKFMTTVLEEEFSTPGTALSGPSFALEVLRGLPTAVTIAAKDLELAKRAADLFHAENFRTYTSSDVVGVELGGAVKNIIAIAAGIVDSLGMGASARAALITRGLAEMQRLVLRLGGDRLTVVGLSGLGDLLLTATTDLSRNRRVGLQLGKGRSLPEILQDLGQVAEGVETSRKVVELARRNEVEMPIAEEVQKVLEGQSTVQQSVKKLLGRAQRDELQ